MERGCNADAAAEGTALEDFYQDFLRLGCLRVFRHFSLYLRGREELMVTVKNVDFLSPTHTHEATSSGRAEETRWRNHEKTACQGSLAPASPATSELKQTYAGETLFLIGAYARYKYWPYVWLRSNCLRGPANGFDPDIPLLLHSTNDWDVCDHLKIWNIVEELVGLNAASKCNNPFEVGGPALDSLPNLSRIQVDFTALRELPDLERACMAAGMASFLHTLLLSMRPPYARAVRSDLRLLLELHFRDMSVVLPVKKEHQHPENPLTQPTVYRI